MILTPRMLKAPLCGALLALLPAMAVQAAEPASAPSLQQTTLDKGVYEVAYSPQRRQVLVAVSGDRTQEADRGYIAVLNPDTLAVDARYPTAFRPFGLALDDSAGMLYTTNTVDSTVSKYDIAHGGRLIDTLRLSDKAPDDLRYPYRPREARLDHQRHRLYVTGLAEDGRLYVIDTRTMKLVSTINHMGPRPSALDYDADHHRIFVGNAQGEVVVISADTLKEEARFAVGGLPLNLVYDSARQTLYVADYQQNVVHVVEARSGQPYKTVSQLVTEKGPLALMIDPRHDTLTVTERLNGSVSTFDLKTQALIKRDAVSSFPNSLALDPVHGVRFVTIKQERTKDKAKDRPEAVGRLP